jgi:hypothetical protein
MNHGGLYKVIIHSNSVEILKKLRPSGMKGLKDIYIAIFTNLVREGE